MFRLNRNKQKTNRNVLIESIFCRLFLYRFETTETNQNELKFLFAFTKQTETQPLQILFQFVSVRIEIVFGLFQGHPTSEHIK
jgi:hypothetical protein